MKRTFTYKLNSVLFLLPALILFIGILIAPIIMSTIYSLHDFSAMISASGSWMNTESAPRSREFSKASPM